MSVIDDRPVRIQVKTSSVWCNGRWSASVCTWGGNRSWSGMVKRLDADTYDYLFVLVGDGRQWFIPSKKVDGGCGLNLGGPKYAEYEIDPGQPLRNYRPSLH